MIPSVGLCPSCSPWLIKTHKIKINLYLYVCVIVCVTQISSAVKWTCVMLHFPLSLFYYYFFLIFFFYRVPKHTIHWNWRRGHCGCWCCGQLRLGTGTWRCSGSLWWETPGLGVWRIRSQSWLLVMSLRLEERIHGPEESRGGKKITNKYLNRHRGWSWIIYLHSTAGSVNGTLAGCLPSCVFVGSWGVCRTCHTSCTDKACPTCERACVSFGRCCLQTFCRSLQTHTGTASLLQKKHVFVRKTSTENSCMKFKFKITGKSQLKHFHFHYANSSECSLFIWGSGAGGGGAGASYLA